MMSERSSEGGFTLPELMMSIALLAIIMAPLTLAFITALRIVGRADEKLVDSRSAEISAAFFSADVAASSSVAAPASSGVCGGGTAVISFTSGSTDYSVSGSTYVPTTTAVTSYVRETQSDGSVSLIRKYCASNPNTVTTKTAAALSLAATGPTVACSPTPCGGTTRLVSMTVIQKANTPTPQDPTPSPFQYALSGTRRPT